MGYHVDHFCIQPVDKDFMPTDEQYLDVMEFYVEKGLVTGDIGQTSSASDWLMQGKGFKWVPVKEGVLWHRGRVKLREAYLSRGITEYDESIEIPEEFEIAKNLTNQLLNSEWASYDKKRLVERCLIPIEELARLETPRFKAYVSYLQLTEEMKEFFYIEGLLELFESMTMTVNLFDGIWGSDLGPSKRGKTILLDIAMGNRYYYNKHLEKEYFGRNMNEDQDHHEPIHDYRDYIAAMENAKEPLVDSRGWEETCEILEIKLRKIGIMDGLREIIGGHVEFMAWIDMDQ